MSPERLKDLGGDASRGAATEAVLPVLNTTGHVRRPGFAKPLVWLDLDPFEQGYIEALFASVLPEELYAERAGWRWSPAHEGWLDGPNDEERDRSAREACALSCIDVEPLGFSDLAPETLAAVLKDCELREETLPPAAMPLSADDGREFWRFRQDEGSPVLFPPFAVYLADDGKVYLREAA